MVKILILGGSGLIGKAVIKEMNKYNNLDVFSTYFQNKILENENKSFKLDIDDENNISSILNKVNPEVVISCLRGDFNKQLCLHKKTAEFLKKNNGVLYFFSTANVFDNDLSTAHYESDCTDSHSEYGQFKIKCENEITKILGQNACILRIPQVWGKNSVRMKALLKCIHNNENVTVYPNFIYNVNTDVMIAKQLCYIINKNLNGTFHLGSEDIISYTDFYKKLIERLGFDNYNLDENYDEKGNFALLSKRNDEFPKELKITIESIIDYLVND